jgi:hypothetical protein
MFPYQWPIWLASMAGCYHRSQHLEHSQEQRARQEHNCQRHALLGNELVESWLWKSLRSRMSDLGSLQDTDHRLLIPFESCCLDSVVIAEESQSLLLLTLWSFDFFPSGLPVTWQSVQLSAVEYVHGYEKSNYHTPSHARWGSVHNVCGRPIHEPCRHNHPSYVRKLGLRDKRAEILARRSRAWALPKLRLLSYSTQPGKNFLGHEMPLFVHWLNSHLVDWPTLESARE